MHHVILLFKGESQMDISKNSEMVVLFQCKATATTRYAFSNIKRIFKVMACANKVSISTGDSGLLGIQMVVTVEEKELYVEYYVSALYLDAD